MAKNTKQSKQKKSVLNKLGGLSKRSKFIVVVLIFAVLGGGYLTYKSFAATAIQNAPKTNIMLAEYLSLYDSPGCTSNNVNDPAKNNLKVMNVYCPPNTKGQFWAGSPNVVKYLYPAGSTQVCITAKGRGLIILKDSDRDNSSGYTNYPTKRYELNSPDYKEYCGHLVPLERTDTYLSNDFGVISIYWVNPSLITVSSVARYWYPTNGKPSGGK